MYVDGTDWKDRCGKKVVIRGFNAMTLYWDGYGGQNGNWDKAGDSNFSQINKTGANYVRIMWASVHGGEGWRMPVAGLESSIKNCLKYGMIAMPECHNATGGDNGFESIVQYWSSPDVVEMLNKYQDKIVVNIANEHNTNDFVNLYTDAISRIRKAGFKVPLGIDGPDSWSFFKTLVFFK